MSARTDAVVGRALRNVIVGCGLGGLVCAIACRHEGQDVTILEKAPELSEVGAGIQLPPNASRIMQRFGLVDKLYEAGMAVLEGNAILRWSDGSQIGFRPAGAWQKEKFGIQWHTMHRADYQRVLQAEAQRLGVEIRLGCDVVSVDCDTLRPTVALASGEKIEVDVVVGADGVHSSVRPSVLGRAYDPKESGDLAYRITIPRHDLDDETDALIRGILDRGLNAIWWGESMHVVCYAIRHAELVNLVLICPDNLPLEVSRQPGDLAEMRKLFEGWDPRIMRLLSKVEKALKWKVWVMDDFDPWTKGSVALIGDACHPSVPYAASGAANAVEDGMVLGRLIGLFAASGQPDSRLPDLMNLYQSIRRDRATSIVQLSNSNRVLYHMADGADQENRDKLFGEHDWFDDLAEFPWRYADARFLRELYGHDACQSAETGFTSSALARPQELE